MSTTIGETTAAGPATHARPAEARHGIAFAAALLAAVGVAIVVMVLATHWGLATSSDSARYARTARGVFGNVPMVDSG